MFLALTSLLANPLPAGQLHLSSLGTALQLLTLGGAGLALVLQQLLMHSPGLRLHPLQVLHLVSGATFLAMLVPFTLLEAPLILTALKEWSLPPLVVAVSALSGFCEYRALTPITLSTPPSSEFFLFDFS